MPEPLKNLYNETLIDSLGEAIRLQYPAFDTAGFNNHIFDEQWSQRELKDRMAHISMTLARFLPDDYSEALKILTPVSSRFNGFEYMFFPGFVELYGLDDFELSITALEAMTPFASAEFAIRPFIVKYPKQTMEVMNKWATSDNEHVRRLASEGCRPRLPWAMALPEFKKNPAAVLPILEQLKADESEYVRRSVANNLNDIGKDNPEVLIDIAHQWKGQSKDTDWVVKHACRSLLKLGETQVLSLFGYADPAHVMLKDLRCDEAVNIGGTFNFCFQLESKEGPLGKLRLEYAIDFMKKNGKPSRKVFKIAESDYQSEQKHIDKNHSFKLITTRVYYPGHHGLAIIVNGKELDALSFELEA